MPNAYSKTNIIDRHWWDGQAQGKPGTFTGGDGHLMEQGGGNARASLLTFRSIIDESHIAEFTPFITSLSDNWSSDWSAEHVFGRSDPIYQWKSTGRSISLGFKVPAGSFKEAYVNMCNVSKLSRMLYPYYADGRVSLATAVAKAPLVRIRWANLIMNSQDAEWTPGLGSGESSIHNGLLGVIRSLSITPDLEEGMIEGPGENSYYPKLWNVSVDFGVLHENILGFSKTDVHHAAVEPAVLQDGYEFPGVDAYTSYAYNWIPEMGVDENDITATGYPYGIKSDGCQNYDYYVFTNHESVTDETPEYLEPTSGTPDTDAGILEQEIRQQRLTNFYSRGDDRDAVDFDFINSPSNRDRTLEPEGGRLPLDRTPVSRFTGNRQSPGSRGQGGY